MKDNTVAIILTLIAITLLFLWLLPYGLMIGGKL